MLEEQQMTGSPIYTVKAYLPVNESFGKYNLSSYIQGNYIYINMFLFIKQKYKHS